MRKPRCETNQIDAYSHSTTRGGITVDVRTDEISHPTGRRYEVCFRAGDSTAVLDIPGEASGDLELRIDQAVSAFVACARLRGAQTGR